jgi:hypothetical protein
MLRIIILMTNGALSQQLIVAHLGSHDVFRFTARFRVKFCLIASHVRTKVHTSYIKSTHYLGIKE